MKGIINCKNDIDLKGIFLLFFILIAITIKKIDEIIINKTKKL
jgi:hypothetical protein